MTPRGRSRALDVLLLATLTVTTWAKIHWSFAGQVALEDILALLFLLVFVFDRVVRRDWTLPRGAIALLLVLLGLEVVFLMGFFDLASRDALSQYAKGMTKYFVHFVFLIAGVAHIVRRGKRFHLIAVGALCGGIVLNAVYGVLQLFAKVGAGINLDKAVIGPLTLGQGGVGGINVFGQATGRAGRQLRLARRLPRERARARSEPSRHHARRPDPDPPAVRAPLRDPRSARAGARTA